MDFIITGIPGISNSAEAAILRSRFFSAIQAFLETHPNLDKLLIKIGDKKSLAEDESKEKTNESNNTILQSNHVPIDPVFSFDRLIVPASTREELLNAIGLISVESLVFDQWGLRSIEPYPRSILNFFGPPGTGKTMSAHAVAKKLGRKIICASYADIESKYHGDGPKNVVALFKAAEENNSVLFIDEADSLLSKRLTNVSQGSEQAINSMRSQLLICLERFSGTAIFATNLIQNYDPAFETRVKNIKFDLPDENARKLLWEKHLPKELPLAKDVITEELAKIDDVCGRDIKNAVVDAAVGVALADGKNITLADLEKALRKIISRRSTNREHLGEKDSEIKEKIMAALKAKGQTGSGSDNTDQIASQ